MKMNTLQKSKKRNSRANPSQNQNQMKTMRTEEIGDQRTS
jgi:hypothetical protein